MLMVGEMPTVEITPGSVGRWESWRGLGGVRGGAGPAPSRHTPVGTREASTRTGGALGIPDYYRLQKGLLIAADPQQQAAKGSEQPQGSGWMQGVGPTDIAQVRVAACDILLAHIVVL